MNLRNKTSVSMLVIVFISYIVIISAQSYDYSEKGWPTICSTGVRQSPIDFPQKSSGNYLVTNNYLKIISTNYKPIQGLQFEDYHEKKFVAFLDNVGTLMVMKKDIKYLYDIVEMHVHILSEHTIQGTSYDLEIHLVHQKNTQYLKDQGVNVDPDIDNTYLVIGTIFKASGTYINPAIQKMNIATLAPINGLDINQFVNPHKSFFHYIGGFTSPPCAENVNWVVFENIEQISLAQFEDFKNLILPIYLTGNARVTKPLLGRTIYYSQQSGTNYLKLDVNFMYFLLIIIILFS
jgi:carbonic anhydrase